MYVCQHAQKFCISCSSLDQLAPATLLQLATYEHSVTHRHLQEGNIVMTLARAQPLQPDADIPSIRSCFQPNGTKPFDLKDVLLDHGHPPALRHDYTYSSTQQDQLPATLVLSFDILRLSMLENVCASWSGPLSATIYLPLVAGSPDNTQTTEDTIDLLTKLGSR